jgi:hypothetical protein
MWISCYLTIESLGQMIAVIARYRLPFIALSQLGSVHVCALKLNIGLHTQSIFCFRVFYVALFFLSAFQKGAQEQENMKKRKGPKIQI